MQGAKEDPDNVGQQGDDVDRRAHLADCHIHWCCNYFKKFKCQSGNQDIWQNGYALTYENTKCNENMVSARPRDGEITFKGLSYAIWIKCLIFSASLQSLLASITYRSFPSFWLRVDEPAEKPAHLFSCQFFLSNACFAIHTALTSFRKKWKKLTWLCLSTFFLSSKSSQMRMSIWATCCWRWSRWWGGRCEWWGRGHPS